MKLTVISRLLPCSWLSPWFLPLVFSGFLLFSGRERLLAATIQAPSGSFADVSKTVAKASPGDTVLIPAGTNSWSGLLNISGITLQGAGTNLTIIRDESPPVGNGSPIIQISANTNTLTRVTQIGFSLGVTNMPPFNNYNGLIMVYGSAPLWRVDHCQFNYLTAKAIHVGDASYGLIDHCSFLLGNEFDGVEIYDTTYGDISWSRAASFGSTNAVYYEDNYMYSPDGFGAIDIANGGRCVIRNSVFVGTYVNTHGTETSQRFRSCRYVEVYNNIFRWGPGTNYNDFYTAVDIRGGTALVFSNYASGYNSVATLHYFRATDNDASFTPFFGATGISGWDSNSPVLLSGNANVTSQYTLVVNGANWKTNQWAGCTVYNFSNNLCGMVSGNTANTMSFLTSRTAIYQISFKAGDPFTVHCVYPMLDAPGRGQGDLLTGDNPKPVWLHEKSEPIYIWGNSLYVVHKLPDASVSAIGSPFPSNINTNLGSMAMNVDIFNGAMPGYTALTYPHPLVGGTNVVAPPLQPPSGLNAHWY